MARHGHSFCEQTTFFRTKEMNNLDWSEERLFFKWNEKQTKTNDLICSNDLERTTVFYTERTISLNKQFYHANDFTVPTIIYYMNDFTEQLFSLKTNEIDGN